MKHMKKIIITLALFCLTTSTTFADDQVKSTEQISLEQPVDHLTSISEEEKAFRLNVPEMAMDIRHFIETLRNKSNFDGTAIVIKNDLVIHRSGQFSKLAKSPDMALHYEANMKKETSESIAKYEWVDTINKLDHSFELEGNDDGPVVLTKRNFDNNTTILIISNDLNQDSLAFASEIEAQLK